MEENHIARRNIVGPRDAGTIGVPRVYWGATRPGCANVYDDEFDRHAFGNFD